MTLKTFWKLIRKLAMPLNLEKIDQEQGRKAGAEILMRPS
jgi:hypothetical protein